MARGTVANFDQAKGYGTIRAEDGRELFFHCTQIADGSRTIEVSSTVAFDVIPGHNGRWEAAAVSRLAEEAGASRPQT